MANPKIEGGYYIKARVISNSEITHSPPHVREIWDWLLKEANHKDRKVSGKIIKRGQCFTSYNDIREALSWKVGYRKQRYKKSDCDFSMRFLRSRLMITTQKTTRGLIITICNYGFYQNPKNYVSDNDYDNDYDKPIQTVATINKNVKNEKKIKEQTKEMIAKIAYKNNNHKKDTSLVINHLKKFGVPGNIAKNYANRYPCDYLIRKTFLLEYYDHHNSKVLNQVAWLRSAIEYDNEKFPEYDDFHEWFKSRKEQIMDDSKTPHELKQIIGRA